jgi:glutamine amidotransferase
MIGILSYGSGNVTAFIDAYQRMDIPCFEVVRVEDLARATRLILPGVGAFDNAILSFNASGMRECVERLVFEESMPILGVCVGMQMFATRSDEGNELGLGWMQAQVKKFELSSANNFCSRLPHMGWNSIALRKEVKIFDKIETDECFYFLHSYYFHSEDKAIDLAVTNYGVDFISAVKKENIYGVQFHPEKSHQSGATLLKNFAYL